MLKKIGWFSLIILPVVLSLKLSFIPAQSPDKPKAERGYTHNAILSDLHLPGRLEEKKQRVINCDNGKSYLSEKDTESKTHEGIWIREDRWLSGCGTPDNDNDEIQSLLLARGLAS